MAGPNQGEVYDGYRFLGGDPNSEASWERAAPVSGPEAAGFQSLGGGWYKGPDGGSYQVGRGGAMVQRSEGTGSTSEEGVGKLTEDQGKSGGYARLMADAERSYQQALNEGFNPTGLQAGIANFTDNIPGLGGLGNFIRDDAGDRARQAELQWTDAQLKAMSGAASPEQEVVRNQITNFARPGQDYKYLGDRLRQARTTAFQASKIRAGKAAADVSYPEETITTQINPETGLPSYPAITQLTSGIKEVPLPEGGYGGGSGPDSTTGPGSSQDSAIDFRDPNNRGALADLIATGGWLRDGDGQPYYVEPGAIAQSREAGDEAVGNGVYVRPDRADWTSEGAVRQRQEMWQPARQVDAFVRGAADATSLEFADEIAAGADALIGRGNGQNMGERYRNNVRVQRAIDAADGQDAGFARNAGEVVGYGAAAITQAPRILAQGASRFASPLLNRAVTGVRNALAGGAIAGTAAAGQAEGNALQRAQEFLKAAPVGATVGAAAPVAVNAVASRLAAPVQAAGQFAGRQIGRVGQALGAPGAARLVERSTPNALNSAVEQFGQRMGPRRVQQLSERVGTARALGVDANLITGLDDASVGRVRALSSRDTPARDLAVDSAEATRNRLPSRVRAIADEEISPDQRPTLDVVDELTLQRRSNASAIRQFGDDPVELGEDAILALRSDLSRTALNAAARRAQSSTNPEIRASANRLNQLAATVLDDPNAARLTVREAQDISKALNEASSAAYRSSTPADGPVLKELAQAIRGAGRDSSDGYKAWLAQYGDDSDLIEAATTGRNFVSVSDDPASARSSDAFIRNAVDGTEDARLIQRQAAGQAMQAASSNPGSARTTLDRAASDVDFYDRADAIGADASRISRRARAELQNLTRQQRASPRVGSESSVNLQDAGGAAGIGAADVLQAVTRPVAAVAQMATRRFVSRGFSDAQAEALVEAAIDPRRTDELIALLQTRMSRKEARTLARAVQRQVSSGAGSSGVEQ